MNDLILIHKAIDATFHCYRKGMDGYQKPLRAIEVKKTSYEDVFTIPNPDKKGETISIWTTQPIIMAIGIAKSWGINDYDIMDFWDINTEAEFNYKYKCYRQVIETIFKDIADGEGKHSLDEGAYRFYVKYNLVNNYIKHYRHKPFYDSSKLLNL